MPEAVTAPVVTPEPAKPADLKPTEAVAKPGEPAAPAPAEAAKPPEPPKPDPSARHVAMLAKKDRELQALQQKIKELEPDAMTARELREAKSAIKALQKLGYSFEQAQEEVLNGGKLNPETEERLRLAEETTSLKKTVEEMKAQKAAEEQQRQEAFRAQKVAEFKGQIAEKAKAAFPLSAAYGDEAVEMAFSVIDRHYAQTLDEETGVGEILTIEQALAQVEAAVEAKVERLLTTDKVKAKLGGAVSKPAVQQAASESGRAVRTLTNSAAATSAKPTTEPLTWEQRRQRALAALDRSK